MSKCILCGTEYEVCKLCKNVYAHTPWRMLCDSARHFGIYNCVLELRDGVTTPSEALEQFERINLTVDEVKTFVPSVQKVILPVLEGAQTANVKSIEVNEDNVSVQSEQTAQTNFERPTYKKRTYRNKK